MKTFILIGLCLVLTQACVARSVQQSHDHHHPQQQQQQQQQQKPQQPKPQEEKSEWPEKSEWSEKAVQLNSDNPFYQKVAEEFTQYSVEYFESVHHPTEETLKQLKKQKWPEHVVEEIENLKHADCTLHCILNDAKNQTIPKVIQTYGVLNNLQAYYNTTAHKDSPVWKLMKQYNIENVIEQYRNDINKYFDKFVENFKIYASMLEGESAQHHQELFEWFEHFVSEKDKELRFYKFLEFFFYWDNFDFAKFWNA